MRRYTIGVLSSLVLYLAAAVAQEAKPGLTSAQQKELKRIGRMVAQVRPVEEIESALEAFLKPARNLDLEAAGQVLSRETEREAQRNVELAQKRLERYTMLEKEIGDEVSRTRRILADRKQGKTDRPPVQTRLFDLDPDPRKRVAIRRGPVITTTPEIEAYLRLIEADRETAARQRRLAQAELEGASRKMTEAATLLARVLREMNEMHKSLPR